MDLKQDTRPATDETRDFSATRAVAVLIGSALSYGIGYYLAIAILFSIFGLDNASDAPWEIATIGLGSLLAGIAGSLVSPRRSWAPLIAALVIASVALMLGLFVDIGFDFGIGTGAMVALGVALTAYAVPAN